MWNHAAWRGGASCQGAPAAERMKGTAQLQANLTNLDRDASSVQFFIPDIEIVGEPPRDQTPPTYSHDNGIAVCSAQHGGDGA